MQHNITHNTKLSFTLWQSRVLHFRFNNGHTVILQKVKYVDVTNSVLFGRILWNTLFIPSFELQHLQNITLVLNKQTARTFAINHQYIAYHLYECLLCVRSLTIPRIRVL